MEEIKRTEISVLGEFSLIDRLTKNFKLKNRSSIKGVGDDAAVLDHEGYRTIVSTDLLVEGIHFDLSYFPLRHLGFKSVIANLSDIYAMNATPKQITVSIALSNRFPVEAMDELYFGIQTACEAYNVDLVGGDTTSSRSGLIISITALGIAPEKDIVYRSGAGIGDLICVSGDLGASYLGLQILERERRLQEENPEIQIDLEDQKYIIGRFLKPETRPDIIEAFKDQGIKPTSMIDISDGLASEIMHICKNSGTGAVIYEKEVPIAIETQQMAIKFNIDPITAALSGGEDYELLFTIQPEDLDKVKLIYDVKIIGVIKDPEYGINLMSSGGKIHEITAQGWRHF
ncbi:MAG: thiamine-phosphate kinase [Saprospiraceae bacterium]|nr:thiamine-phosphate kinase [Saprospiraceae bacterium]